jgi:hypothetical protein
VPTGGVFLERLRARHFGLASRLLMHETGQPLPSLAGVGLVLFWLGDPLRQKYPDCFAEAAAIARAAMRKGIPILNSPEGLSNTAKAVQSRIWAANGIPSARVNCIETPGQLTVAYSEMSSPCLLRGDETHAEHNIRTIRTMAEAEAATRAIALPAALVEVRDVRAEYRAAGASPQDLYSRFHHKARAFVFRREVKASHLFFSRDLVVGLSNSLFAREERSRRRLLRTMGFRRKLFDALIAEDLHYYRSDLPYQDILVRSVAALGLDMAAVDYSIRPDGSPILWEANPYFSLPRGEDSVLCTERMAIGRVNASLDWMAHCLWQALPVKLAS